MTGLKPCPFCGSPAELLVEDYGHEWWVECTNRECGITTGITADGDMAREIWNRRVKE